MIMWFDCCKNCVAPKRYPGCHSHCQEYIDIRAEYDKRKAAHNQKREIDCAIAADRARKIQNAMKDRRHKKI